MAETSDEQRSKIAALKDEINAVNAEKEKWFGLKEEYKQKIQKAIDEIKSKRSGRDALTGNVRSIKVERSAAQDLIKAQIDKITKLRTLQTEIQTKLGISGDFEKLRSTLARFEEKLETEAIPFKKEKELMEKIKDVKKKMKEASALTTILDEINKERDILHTLRKDSNTKHKQLIENAKQSQEHHEGMIDARDSLTKLKKEEEEAFAKFIEYKKKYTELSIQLKNLQGQAHEEREKAQSEKEEKRREHRKKEDQVLKEMGATVEEKIKKRQKLTTEDLLVMQRQQQKDE